MDLGIAAARGFLLGNPYDIIVLFYGYGKLIYYYIPYWLFSGNYYSTSGKGPIDYPSLV